MADDQCSPLWEPGANPYPVEPESLPISAKLSEQLWDWAAAYDATLNLEDPASGGFLSEQTRQEFIQSGAALQQRLQDELGDDFDVPYFDQY